ncbi:MAG: ATP-binding protein [bacterium]
MSIWEDEGGWYKLPSALFLMGLFAAFLLIWMNQINNHIILRYNPQYEAIRDIQITIYKSHLWLEEYLQKNIELDYKKADNNFSLSLKLVDALLKGGSFKDYGHKVLSLNDPGLRKGVGKLKSLLLEYKTVTLKKNRNGGLTAFTPEMEYEHDGLFLEIIDELQILRKTLNKKSAFDESRKYHVFEIALAAWILVIILAVTGLGVLERRRKHTRKELYHEKEQLAITLGSIGDGVISTDTATKVVLVNKESEKLTGWTREEAAGRPLKDIFHIIHENNRQVCQNPVEKAFQSGRNTTHSSTILIARDGSERIIASSGAPVRDRSGTMVGAVLVFRDITRQRKTEAEIQQINQRESVTLLAGGIAHDFNNILTAILGNISLARIFSGLDKGLDELLDSAEKASIRAKKLTQQLLSFAKGDSPVFRTVSIAETIEETVTFVLRGTKASSKIIIPDDFWAVEINESQVSQVIQNMVLNACQAMPGGGQVEIICQNVSLNQEDSASLDLEPGTYVKISIKDQGKGISPEHLRQVFDPYFSTKQKGSGLGLAIAFSIVEKHKGKITVDSEKKKGTTFSIYLPAFPKKTELKEKKEELLIQGSGKILVMDDTETVRQVLNDMLSNIGYQVATAASGGEAVEIYKRFRETGESFDAVIMDLTVPGAMGGREAMGKLREINPEAVGIAISGYSDDSVMTDFRKHGFSEAITKPIKIQELSQVLKKLIIQNNSGSE